VLGALLIGTLTACGGGSGTPTAAHRPMPTASTLASPSASSGDALAPAIQAALTAYDQAWNDLAVVSDEGNYQDPRLAAHLSGQLLLTTSQDLYLEESHGIATRGQPVLHPRIEASELAARPPTVTIADCIDFHQFVKYYKTSGAPYGVSQAGLSADTTTMTLVNGTWMVTDEKMQADGSCAA
jgi:hypothetical protein